MTKTRIRVLLGCSLALFLFFLLGYLTNHYGYYTAGEILEYNQVYVDTTYVKKEEIKSGTSNTGIYGPMHASYEVAQVNDTVTTTIFNTFKISGLKPMTEYEVSLRFDFNMNDISEGSTLSVGFINYEPEEIYVPETGVVYNNISDITKTAESSTTAEDVESVADITEVTTEESGDAVVNSFDKFNVLEGTSTYQIDTTFQTNEKGEVWLVIGVDSTTYNYVNYDISNILFNYTEMK